GGERSGEGVQLAAAEHVVLAVRRLAEGVQADGDHGAEVDDQGDDLEDEIHEGAPISGEGTGAQGRRGRVTASRGRHRTPGEDPAEQARDGPGRTSVAERSPTVARRRLWTRVASTLRPDVAAHSAVSGLVAGR